MISLNLRKRIYTSILLLFLTLIVFGSHFLLTYVLIIASILSLIEFYTVINKINLNKLINFISKLIFTLYIFLFSYIFFFFTSFINLKTIIFIILMGCIASDIGGYVVGKNVKGPKLTRISPKKTISGALGSIIFTIITISILVNHVFDKFNFQVLIISIITSLACQIGDLFFSYLKRKAKIKDFSNYLPGHGGILDRIDGIYFGIPAGIITFIFLI